MTRWVDLEPPWRACLQLAWEAYGQGTTPVGAVIVDPEGRVVAEGRNARYAGAGEPLAGSHIAHAEVLALGRMSSGRDYPGHALYTTLEPCLLCVGAAVMSNIGHVHFAGADPYGGAAAIVATNAHLRRGLTAFSGPRPDALGAFAAALHVEFYLRRKPGGHVVAAYRESMPAAVTAAEAFAGMRLQEAAAAGAPVHGSFDRAVAHLD